VELNGASDEMLTASAPSVLRRVVEERERERERLSKCKGRASDKDRPGEREGGRVAGGRMEVRG